MKKANGYNDDKVSFETFREFSEYEKRNLTQKEPSCFNGIVRIRKYKITIEHVEESNEVLAERLQKLWDDANYNWHHYQPLQEEAKKIGYELKNSMGSNRNKLKEN